MHGTAGSAATFEPNSTGLHRTWQARQHDRIEIPIHLDAHDLTRFATVSVDLYRAGQGVWRQGRDQGGEVDVAVIEIDRALYMDEARIEPRPDFVQFQSLMVGIIAEITASKRPDALPLAAE